MDHIQGRKKERKTKKPKILVTQTFAFQFFIKATVCVKVPKVGPQDPSLATGNDFGSSLDQSWG
ncbi:uncharacterized protein DS421_8g239200 [Arachis hypogaea]|nr:uncharacterized protein DS421_8g239200 [Arachis hypogaea]